MKQIFIVSDTHLGHSNFLNFLNDKGEQIRKFASVEEMDETIIANWNSVVGHSDTVYHLGDVYFGQGHKHLWRLNGRKHLVVGNHDELKSEHLHKHFEKIMLWRHFKDFDMLLSHVPIHESEIRKAQFNVHGHIHEKPSPTPRHINMCVEHHNYTPVAIEEVLK